MAAVARSPCYNTAPVSDLTPEQRASWPAYHYVTCRPVTFRTRYGDVTVPKGFLCDGSTKSPDFGSGYLVHDFLYAVHRFDDGSPCTREQADDIMYDQLVVDGYYYYAHTVRATMWLNPCWAFSRAWASSGARGAEFLE